MRIVQEEEEACSLTKVVITDKPLFVYKNQNDMNKKDFNDGTESTEEESPWEESDEDTCDFKELSNEFAKKTLLTEEAISLGKAYALHLANDSGFEKVAVGVSNGMVQVFNLTPTSLVRSYEPLNVAKPKSTICGVSFPKSDSNNLIVGTTDGTLSIHDLRTGRIQFKLETDEASDKKRPLTCFDVNSNERILCAGTEQIVEDVYLLFFDIRQRRTLGGYWNSHTEDVTSIKWHPTKSDILMSGSTDGLINIFDISETSEDNALKMVINTEDSVCKLQWHKNIYNKDVISCITNSSQLKMYDGEETDLICKFDRASITQAMKRTSVDECYLINCHDLDKFGTQFLCAGSHKNKGETLRSLKIQQKSLQPLANYEQNKQIVRDSLYDAKKNILVTAGEAAIISVWTDENVTMNLQPSSNDYKVKSKIYQKLHSKKPY